MPSKNEEPQFSSDDLIIPIYIDTNALFDLLASIEGGFSVVEKVTTRTANSRNSEQSVSANAGTEFGIPHILNLLKINLNGSLNRRQSRDIGEERASERYHTYGSLLQRLRDALLVNLVKTFDGSTETWDRIKPHDFVELRGKFRLNPLTDSFGTVERMAELYEIFAQAQTPNPSRQANKPKLQTTTLNNMANPFNQVTSNQVRQIRTIIKGMLNQLEKEDIRITVINLHSSSMHRAVAYLFTEYLRDRSMTELQNKEYKLLGKVVDKTSGQNDAIDLLQGTAFSGFDEATISSLVNGFNQPSSGINLPKIETKITAPALQVIPIAIYV
jgi:hypothetical protein